MQCGWERPSVRLTAVVDGKARVPDEVEFATKAIWSRTCSPGAGCRCSHALGDRR